MCERCESLCDFFISDRTVGHFRWIEVIATLRVEAEPGRGAGAESSMYELSAGSICDGCISPICICSLSGGWR